MQHRSQAGFGAAKSKKPSLGGLIRNLLNENVTTVFLSVLPPLVSQSLAIQAERISSVEGAPEEKPAAFMWVFFFARRCYLNGDDYMFRV